MSKKKLIEVLHANSEFSRVLKYSKKVFEGFENVFHVYLMRGFQKYAGNWILTMAFWATCKIAQPIQPIWQHIFAPPWSALKKPPWEFNFFHIFEIPSASRHENCCQILQTLFGYFNTLETHSVQLVFKFACIFCSSDSF